ncbi:hypothetical protein, partial [Biformimicrobium ophioploci]|uniref:hypothetical protein n=1 Tax=Biformimicrobium ophioploci TaxID=3036711 RepID=UPI0025550CDF
MFNFFETAVMLVLLFSGYWLISYPVLSKFGVRESLVSRSVAFGSSLFLIQFIVGAAFSLIGLGLMGLFAGLYASYVYVGKVLNISPLSRVLVSLLLPIVGGIISGAALLTFFELH